jgi:hypothetical protein
MTVWGSNTVCGQERGGTDSPVLIEIAPPSGILVGDGLAKHSVLCDDEDHPKAEILCSDLTLVCMIE